MTTLTTKIVHIKPKITYMKQMRVWREKVYIPRAKHHYLQAREIFKKLDAWNKSCILVQEVAHLK